MPEIVSKMKVILLQKAIDALDLINRREAEIERLMQKLQQPQSEAIKEFAERFESTLTPTVIAMAVIGEILVAVSKSHISAESAIDKIREQMPNAICTRHKLQQMKDNLVKEMVGERE